jgi:cysteinyl-tRNA synthetase
LRRDNKGDDQELSNGLRRFKATWVEAMSDDFNTADALGNLFELVRAINRSIDSFGWTPTLKEALEELRSFGRVMGILELDPSDYLKRERPTKTPLEITEEEIEHLIEERAAARREKNWKRADEIREYLNSKGILLEDSKEGTIWRVKT